MHHNAYYYQPRRVSLGEAFIRDFGWAGWQLGKFGFKATCWLSKKSYTALKAAYQSPKIREWSTRGKDWLFADYRKALLEIGTQPQALSPATSQKFLQLPFKLPDARAVPLKSKRWEQLPSWEKAKIAVRISDRHQRMAAQKNVATLEK